MTAEAKTLSATPAPAPAPALAPQTAYQVGQNVGETLNPYYQAFNPGNLIQGTSDLLSATGNFFTGLFGF